MCPHQGYITVSYSELTACCVQAGVERGAGGGARAGAGAPPVPPHAADSARHALPGQQAQGQSRVSRVQLRSTCQCIVSISTQLKVLHSLVKVSSNTTIIITSAVVVSMPSFVLAAGWLSARCLTEIDTDSAACQLDIVGVRVTLVQYLTIPRIIRNGRLGSLPLPILLGAASPRLCLCRPLKHHWTRPLSSLDPMLCPRPSKVNNMYYAMNTDYSQLSPLFPLKTSLRQINGCIVTGTGDSKLQ